MLVVVSDDRITQITPVTRESLAQLPAGAEVLNAEGQWILPGLIDAHVHAESDDDLKRMLRWGVTSVRLMAEDAAKAVGDGEGVALAERHPRPLPGGADLHGEGGLVGPGRGAGREPEPLSGHGRGGARGGAAGVRAGRQRDQADARRHGLVPQSEAAPAAHGRGRSRRRCSPRPRGQSCGPPFTRPKLADAREADRAAAPRRSRTECSSRSTAKPSSVMRERPVFYIPTMGIFEFLANTPAFVKGVLSDQRVATTLPRQTLARYAASAYARQYRERYPNAEGVRQALPALRENLRNLQAAGVPVALGTDMWAFPGRGSLRRARPLRPLGPPAGRSPPRRHPDGGPLARRRRGPGHAGAGQTRRPADPEPRPADRHEERARDLARSTRPASASGRRCHDPIARSPDHPITRFPRSAPPLSPRVPDPPEVHVPHLQLARGDAAGGGPRPRRIRATRGRRAACGPGRTPGGTCRSTVGDRDRAAPRRSAGQRLDASRT